ncbi:MBL fold metallo-hydrolase [Micromonospora chersina]|uniref:MBL fold metallo-hydrolase n=1 Tax=Micromonospora chersina TaxID=47854 RepID=UPI00371924B2
MRIHHLNCGSMREVAPPSDPDGTLRPLPAVCHCLLVETDSAGLVLVETGYGTLDIRDPERRLGADFLAWAQPVLDPEETAVRQLRRLGYAPADVRHVVVTHLHRDHTGGLADFPHARVHLHEAEHRAATVTGHDRYLPTHWAHDPNWVTYSGDAGERWRGFDGVQQLAGLPPEILLVPLAGHTPGHVAVAVRRPTGGGSAWLVHAGDAYFYRGEVQPGLPPTPPAFDALQASVETDRPLRLRNVDRLRALLAEQPDQVDVVSAHDPWEFARHRREAPVSLA